MSWTVHILYQKSINDVLLYLYLFVVFFLEHSTIGVYNLPSTITITNSYSASHCTWIHNMLCHVIMWSVGHGYFHSWTFGEFSKRWIEITNKFISNMFIILLASCRINTLVKDPEGRDETCTPKNNEITCQNIPAVCF